MVDVHPPQDPRARPAEPPVRQELVGLGRIVFLTMAALVLSAILAGLILMPSNAGIARFCLVAGVLFAMWLGKDWAIVAAAILFSLSALVGVLTGIASSSIGHLVSGAAYAVVPIVLVRSQSLNEFFKYQRQAHLPLDADEELMCE
jgi:hypothetical protein